jgi:SAM-dependent methyltransferase
VALVVRFLRLIVHRTAVHLLLCGSAFLQRPLPVASVSGHATIGPMSIDDRFDELAASLGGFYRTWAVYLGLELGLFARLRDAGTDGLTPAELAAASECQTAPVEVWIRLAHSVDLVEFDGRRARPIDDVITVLLADERPEYLGGQFVSTVVSSLDYDRMAEYFRTGRSIPERPPRFHRAIEAVTAQDIAVFFQEALAELPDLAASLAGGGRVLDVACGGGRWLIAVARRFPATSLVGVEFEPDSVGRAMRHVSQAGLGERIVIENRDPGELPYGPEFDLVYFQDALHELPDPVAALRSAWATVRPGGRLLVLDWCLPATVEESRSLHGAMLWGIQLDELYQGTEMWDHAGYLALFAEAGTPLPSVIDLPSGATLFLVVRPA